MSDSFRELPPEGSRVVASWESARGRYWVNLYLSDDGTFRYRTDNGFGQLGARVTNFAEALDIMTAKIPDLRGPSLLRRTL